MIVASLMVLAVPVVAEAADRPNVLIIMTDDQGLGDFSYTGNPILKTPNFDAFAKSAIRLTDFHVAPMCSPTRGQLLTGLAALRNGATSVTAGRTFMRTGLATLPGLFAKAGYNTGIFGKWHLGDHYPHRPIDRGFQTSVYHLGWGMLNSTPEFDWPLIDGRCFVNGHEQQFKGHCTDFWFDSAMSWMKACSGRRQPFFCYLPTNAPHAPWIELQEYVKPYRGKGPAGFFGMISHLDRRFGDLERFLSNEGLRDNTIVIFMTDNGGTAGVATYNAGLRAGKTTYYDGGHRVPCWIRWPNGMLGQPRDISIPTQNTDLLPTLCDLCDIALPAYHATDTLYRGSSLASLMRTAGSGPPNQLAGRKLVVQYGQTPVKFDSCVIWEHWRLVKGEELYDIETDRGQRTSVASKFPDIVRTMRDYYEVWWKGVEPILNDFVPISIGSRQQPVVDLTSGDWEGIYADNNGHVRDAVGGPTGGHWHIHVDHAGDYEFVLRRWPERTKAALGGAYERPETAENTKKAKPKTFPEIAQAHVAIANVKVTAQADSTANGVSVTARLPAGRTTLKAWFADANGNNLCGAFFVTVRKK
jgi:arylsulfatase